MPKWTIRKRCARGCRRPAGQAQNHHAEHSRHTHRQPLAKQLLRPDHLYGQCQRVHPHLNDLPQQLRAKFSPETLEQMSGINNRFATIVNLIDGDRVYLPFTVVHAERVD
jgi:hypothetical protein